MDRGGATIMMRCDVAVIGAGAAGMMCAAVAGQRGARVVLIDHATKLAEKIGLKLSGPLAFFITGDFNDPKVKLDSASILKQPGVEKATDELLKQGEKLLKGLFKR